MHFSWSEGIHSLRHRVIGYQICHCGLSSFVALVLKMSVALLDVAHSLLELAWVTVYSSELELELESGLTTLC